LLGLVLEFPGASASGIAEWMRVRRDLFDVQRKLPGIAREIKGLARHGNYGSLKVWEASGFEASGWAVPEVWNTDRTLIEH
jgi:hypothetical protein